MYIVIAFRSRNHSISFSQLLNSYKIKNNVISTPRQILASCSLSVKISKTELDKAKELLARRNFDSLIGVFEVTDFAGERIIRQLSLLR